MLKPTGFWSYTSSDDTASRGRLSQLRRLLADELQLKIGRLPKVHIFQDVAAIPHGTDWLKEIHRALDDSSFLIPIVTPAFLQSEMCCAEVIRFRQREQEIGRDDLIFPFHYIRVDDVDPNQTGECYDAAVLELLQRRQWIDFRSLRLRNVDGEDVSVKLEALADSIRAALRRTAAPAIVLRPTAASPVQSKSPAETPRPVTPAAPVPGNVLRDGPIYPEMVLVPPGRFVMGTPKEEGSHKGAQPQHEVTISRGFYLGKYAVTRDEFAAFVADTGYVTPTTALALEPDSKGDWRVQMLGGRDWRNPGFPQLDRDPVVCVSKTDAAAYTEWLSDKTAKPYRLPSEAEWEYAARAGTQTAWFWGDDWKLTSCYANFGDDTLRKLKKDEAGVLYLPEDGFAFTAPVGSFLPNAFGLYDMLGNVEEWTADDWHETYDGAPTDGSAWIGGTKDKSVVRGGFWFIGWPTDASARSGFHAGFGYNYVGFRVARNRIPSDP
jgi:formylglycine-generating enzyme